uniref:Mitotic spindle assembly checkpoint protein MAD1 n=1 Tax=Sus scrofa TaxID=9823 RepID=A0A8D1HKP8_PIG
MEDLGENTTVLSTLRSLNSFISQRVEGGSGLDVSTPAQGSLQMQYQQSMQLEERAEQIRSKSHLIQVEREKMQMELSHKRARVELERAASTSARSYEREVDRNQELLTRIRQLQEREAEAEEKMKEQLERYRLCQQSLDAASRKLREEEDSLAEAGETISALKGRLSELQWSAMNQEMQVKRLESEKQELKEQLDLQHKKWQEAQQKVQELQASQDARADQEQRIKDLEQKLSLQEQDAAIVRSMRSELVRLPTMERELRQLREENACLRETREASGLLREELEGLQRRLGRQEKLQENLVNLELENERLLTKLQSWERLGQTTGLSIRTPEELSSFIVELQQRELTLKDRNSTLTSSARGLEKARLQLQEEVRQVSSQLLEERKKRETHEALARRLQKRVLLLTKERDGMRAILGSYDSELTPAEYAPQLTRRLREAEDMVQKVHAHSSEVEVQLSQALEELGGQKQRADALEMELQMLKSQAGPAEQSFLFSREEVSALRYVHLPTPAFSPHPHPPGPWSAALLSLPLSPALRRQNASDWGTCGGALPVSGGGLPVLRRRQRWWEGADAVCEAGALGRLWPGPASSRGFAGRRADQLAGVTGTNPKGSRAPRGALEPQLVGGGGVRQGVAVPRRTRGRRQGPWVAGLSFQKGPRAADGLAGTRVGFDRFVRFTV